MAGVEFWVLFALIIYLLINIALYFIQDYFLFHPEKLHSDFVFKYDAPFDEIVLEGSNHSTIDALLFKVENSKKVVFYFKGNTRSMKGWGKFAKDFTGKGMNFFMIDYPGFGKSTGKRNEQTIYSNAQIAYDWLKDQFGEENIIIYGRSLGAGFSAYIASQNSPSQLILDSPYYSMSDLARYYTRIINMKWILKYKVPLCEFVKRTKCPVNILHGNRDWIIPYRFSPMIVKTDPERIHLYTISGAGHNNLPKFEEYHSFLNKLLHDESDLTEEKKC